MACQKLHCLRNLDGGNDMRDRGHNTCRFACRGGTWRRKTSEQTTQAWTRPRNHGHHQTIAPNSSGVDPGLPMLGACVVNDETRLKIIKPIEYEIDIGNIVFDVSRVHIVHFGVDVYRGIYTAKFRFRSNSLGQVVLDVILIEERLPL